MRVVAAVKYIIIFLLIAVVGVLIGAAYQKYFRSPSVVPNPIVKNQSNLENYLTAGGTLPKKSISIVRQNTWKETTNCTAEARDKERIFCVEDFMSNGVLTVNVYPNVSQIALTDPKTVDRLLNLLILSVFETRFSLDPKAKNPVVDYGEENYIFKW